MKSIWSTAASPWRQFSIKNIVAFLAILLMGKMQAQSYDLDSVYFYEVNEQDFLKVEDLMGDKGLVLVFTSSYCPYCQLYEDRLLEIKSEFDSLGINFVLINSNNSTEINIVTIEDMREESTRLGISYVSDQGHEVMNALGVRKNPEIVVIRPVVSGYEKAYQGSLDDSPKDPGNVRDPYLRRVLANLIQDKPSPIKRTHPVGCMIR